MSTTPSKPTPSPIPNRSASPPTSSKPESTRPHPRPAFPTITLRLKVPDLNHPGACIFFDNCNPSTALSSAVDLVLGCLYKPTKTNAHIPPTRSVTLIFRSMPGVAYTVGSSLDNDHKEIHLSMDYIGGVSSNPPNRQHDEIQGVLVHEMVHCWQWNGIGTAPSGLIEGIADFVRLKAGLSPPHWKKEYGGDWDAGYQHTAYFLEWLENIYGVGSVRKINDRLRERKYIEGEFWKDLFGKDVCELWEDYSKTFDEKSKGDGAERGEKAKRNKEEEEEEEGEEDEKAKGNKEEEDEVVLVEKHGEEQKVPKEKGEGRSQ
ncbi:hypothetical protein MMC29_007594 [Sticta canariensis]|nr:hypothetical protein [Sticta canariensis]